MAAGDFGAGDGPAGEDPIEDAPAPRDTTPAAAIYFDGASRTFPFDSAGKLIAEHPVDQVVALACLVELGKIASAQDVGAAVRNLRLDDAARLKTDVDARLREALRRPLAAGDIRIDSIEAVSRVSGRVSVRLRYFNLRLPGSAARAVASS